VNALRIFSESFLNKLRYSSKRFSVIVNQSEGKFVMKKKGNETNWLVGAGFNIKGERKTLSVSLGENERYIRNKILKEKDNYALLVIEKWHGIPVQTGNNQPAVLVNVKLIWYAKYSDRHIFYEFYKGQKSS